MYRMLGCQPCHLLTSRVDPQYSLRPPFFRWYSPLSAGCYFPNNYTAYFRCTGWHIIGLLQTGIGSLKLFENFRVASQSNVVLIKSLLCPTELISFWYNRPRWLNIQNSTVCGSTTVSSQYYCFTHNIKNDTVNPVRGATYFNNCTTHFRCTRYHLLDAGWDGFFEGVSERLSSQSNGASIKSLVCNEWKNIPILLSSLIEHTKKYCGKLKMLFDN